MAGSHQHFFCGRQNITPVLRGKIDMGSALGLGKSCQPRSGHFLWDLQPMKLWGLWDSGLVAP